MEQQQPSSTQDILIPSPNTALPPTEITMAQILNYFQMPDGLLDKSEEEGLYAEVYAMLKEEHHFFFKRNYSPVVKKLIRSASNSCSACVSHVKHKAFYTIFRALLPPSAAVKGFVPFSDPVCQQILGFNAQKKLTNTMISDTSRYLLRCYKYHGKEGVIAFAAIIDFARPVMFSLGTNILINMVVNETIAHNSELESAATADVAVDELVGSVAGVTLDTTTSLETGPTATGPENRSQIDVMETAGTVPSEGSKL
ncbi:hypothetical protein EDD18DRAFT_1098868 [Armillaria luteobubalina]|uniref:Uncharacterized protein n=1 Tax=Armillaria luteobubalina TaxID=153913 RepID=A0AA39QPF7_9AGAR|nr:hypothetical protein EDD18DRAFT_1098868 [Armillaria luteobubalina]